MKLLVLGGSRGIGLKVVEAALAAGHTVRAMSRSAGSMPPREGLEPVAGDATNSADLGPALEGVDAVGRGAHAAIMAPRAPA